MNKSQANKRETNLANLKQIKRETNLEQIESKYLFQIYSDLFPFILKRNILRLYKHGFYSLTTLSENDSPFSKVTRIVYVPAAKPLISSVSKPLRCERTKRPCRS